MKKRGIAILVIISLISFGSLSYKYFFKTPFQYAGTIEATRVDLPARLPTIVKTILVDEGQIVTKNQPIATLGCEDLQVAFALSKDNFERASKLKKTGSISTEVFDQIRNKHDEMSTKMSWCQISSPIEGTVITRFLEPGEWVNPGTKILTLANLKKPWTYFYVSQELMSQLRVGTKIRGNVLEIGDSFNGTIVKINEEAEFTPKNVQTQSERTRLVFGVKVAFENEDGKLKPGMTILSELKLTTKGDY